jgi:hypothetical protein
VDHIVKVLGTYFAPYGVMISTAVEYLSGYHWEKKGFSEAQGSYFLFPEGRGTRTSPPHMYVDVTLEKEFVVKGLRLNVGMNAYNLLNSQRPVSFVNQDTDLFGQVWSRQLPRWIQLRVILSF